MVVLQDKGFGEEVIMQLGFSGFIRTSVVHNCFWATVPVISVVVKFDRIIIWVHFYYNDNHHRISVSRTSPMV